MTTRILRHRWIVVASFAITLCLGCHRTPARPTVHGQIAINGSAVTQGEIVLTPLDGVGSPASGTISDGRYSLQSSPGKKRVEIQAYEKQGTKPIDPAMPGSAAVPILKPVLPAKYNSASELTLEVSVDTEKNYDITLP